MNVLRDLRRLGLRVLAPAALSVAAAVTVLAGCGGGTSQVQAFTPKRVVVFGDENSVIVDDGSNDGYKYGINDRSSTTAGKCLALPIAAQSVISLYGFVTQACSASSTTATPKAFILAQAGAKVDDPSSGLAQQISQVNGGLSSTDMVTVMIGANDVIELYEQVLAGRLGSNEAVSEAQRRGGHAADQINAILRTGARALVVTVPDMGLSPYAIKQNATNPGARTLMSTLSYEFNAYLRTRIDSKSYDGRNYGLVLADDIVSAMANFPSSYLSSPYNITEAACDATKVAASTSGFCDTTTLVEGASSTSHLWADDRHLGPSAHSRIGSQAQSRAANNPL